MKQPEEILKGEKLAQDSSGNCWVMDYPSMRKNETGEWEPIVQPIPDFVFVYLYETEQYNINKTKGE